VNPVGVMDGTSGKAGHVALRIEREALHVSVSDPAASSMNFLNEVAQRFPEALSLAAGRPFDRFYGTDDIDRYLKVYLDHLTSLGMTDAQRDTALLQYGRTNGQLGTLIARMLATDEDIHVPPEAVMVTAGCQEAMIIALRGVCSRPGDVVLVPDPCYVGFTGAARILGIEAVPVPEPFEGLDPDEVLRVAREVRASGRTPKGLYVVPNFANPTGGSMPVATRRRLLEAAAEADLMIFEDDPYGLFGLDDEPRPSLKALDEHGRVVYLGSFSKSCFPGARVGFLVADQEVVDASGRTTLLAEELSTIKSMLTVNTSPIAQALIGGVLVESGCSLRAANQDKIRFYRENMRTLLSALEREFADVPGVSWNSPDGGFFAVVTVPVVADEALLELSAREYGVLWTPMLFFHTGDGGRNQIRLSCSAVTPEQIDEGVRRLARLVRAGAEARRP
jgi:(S)-3,5-dihydroxyphenylglycine transaminase